MLIYYESTRGMHNSATRHRSKKGKCPKLGVKKKNYKQQISYNAHLRFAGGDHASLHLVALPRSHRLKHEQVMFGRAHSNHEHRRQPESFGTSNSRDVSKITSCDKSTEADTHGQRTLQPTSRANHVHHKPSSSLSSSIDFMFKFPGGQENTLKGLTNSAWQRSATTIKRRVSSRRAPPPRRVDGFSSQEELKKLQPMSPHTTSAPQLHTPQGGPFSNLVPVAGRVPVSRSRSFKSYFQSNSRNVPPSSTEPAAPVSHAGEDLSEVLRQGSRAVQRRQVMTAAPNAMEPATAFSTSARNAAQNYTDKKDMLPSRPARAALRPSTDPETMHHYRPLQTHMRTKGLGEPEPRPNRIQHIPNDSRHAPLGSSSTSDQYHAPATTEPCDNLELKLNRLQLDLEKEMHVISHTSPVDVSRAAPPTPRPAPSRPALSPPRRPTLSAKPPFQIMSPEKYPSLLLQKLDAEKRPELRHTDSSHGAHFLQSKQAVICTTSDDS